MIQNRNWESPESEILINPAFSQNDQQRFKKILECSENLPGHIWLSTSGSTVMKWVGLSKKAILSSAQAMNAHLMSQSSDIWIQTLPEFHVAGLAVCARAFLSGAKIANFKAICAKWDPLKFHRYVQENHGTLTSIVPAQLYDLVRNQLRAPSTLRAVLVGGGALTHDLFEKAVQLNWKVLPTYGLTECASSIAIAPLDCWEKKESFRLKVLPHLEIKSEQDRLNIKGDSLFTTYAVYEHAEINFVDPKQKGWFATEDRGQLQNNELTLLGRLDDCIKIGGERVDFAQLEQRLQTIKNRLSLETDMTLVAYSDERLGHVIHLAIDSKEGSDEVIKIFNQQVLPFERIRYVHLVPCIPRSSLYKVLRRELLAIIVEQVNNI